MALRNLTRHRLRNFLTILGVAAGISVFVTSLSVSSGFKGQIKELLQSYRVDITVQSRGAATPMASRISSGDYERLRGITGVARVSSLTLGTIRTPWHPYFVIAGISGGEAIAGKLNLVDGRMLVEGRGEIMLGRLAASEVGYRVGNRIALRDGELFTIAGVYTFGSRIMDGAAILGREDAQRLLKNDGTVNVAFVTAEDNTRIDAVMGAINRDLQALQAIRSGELVGQVRLFSAVDLFVWVISMISLFTCCIVVMNTLIMAVSERTQEIGIMMAVGWSRGKIYRLIAAEALIICLSGAALGNGLGIVFLNFLDARQIAGMGWIPTAIPLGVAAESLALAVFLGLLASLYPAAVALRGAPAEALRHE